MKEMKMIRHTELSTSLKLVAVHCGEREQVTSQSKEKKKCAEKKKREREESQSHHCKFPYKRLHSPTTRTSFSFSLL